jgi:hypothetical protein
MKPNRSESEPFNQKQPIIPPLEMRGFMKPKTLELLFAKPFVEGGRKDDDGTEPPNGDRGVD